MAHQGSRGRCSRGHTGAARCKWLGWAGITDGNQRHDRRKRPRDDHERSAKSRGRAEQSHHTGARSRRHDTGFAGPRLGPFPGRSPAATALPRGDAAACRRGEGDDIYGHCRPHGRPRACRRGSGRSSRQQRQRRQRRSGGRHRPGSAPTTDQRRGFHTRCIGSDRSGARCGAESGLRGLDRWSGPEPPSGGTSSHYCDGVHIRRLDGRDDNNSGYDHKHDFGSNDVFNSDVHRCGRKLSFKRKRFTAASCNQLKQQCRSGPR